MDYSDTYQKMMEYDSNPLFSFDDPTCVSQIVTTADQLWNNSFLASDAFSSPFVLNPMNSFVMEKVFCDCSSLFFSQVTREQSLHSPCRCLPKEITQRIIQTLLSQTLFRIATCTYRRSK